MHALPTRRHALAAIASSAASLALPGSALAQAFPSKPITIVIPVAVGASTDFVARSLQEPLQRALGQPVIVEAKPGASGMLGARYVAKAAPDGHTLLLHSPGLLIAPQLTKVPDFSPLQDLEPVSLLVSQPFVMLVHSSVPARNLKEFIDYAKANPGKLDFGSSGNGTFSRLATELLMSQARINMVHVPYKGTGEAMQGLLAGQIKVLIASVNPQITAFEKEGRIRVLGVGTLEPSPLAPGVEPMAKTLNGLDKDVWFAVFAPKRTPPEAIAKLQQALQRTVAHPDYRQVADKLSMVVDTTHGDALKTKVEREYKAWGDIIRSANITEN